MNRPSPSSKTLTYLAGIGGADATGAESLSRHSSAKPAPTTSERSPTLMQRFFRLLVKPQR